jgi:hypothetical protein
MLSRDAFSHCDAPYLYHIIAISALYATDNKQFQATLFTTVHTMSASALLMPMPLIDTFIRHKACIYAEKN